jgi:hypothetical protein
MILELSKFFVVPFAAKVELTIQIFHVFKKHEGGNMELARQMGLTLDHLWASLPKVR